MENISIAAFTPGGGKLGSDLKEKLIKEGYKCKLYAANKTAHNLGIEAFKSIGKWTEEHFSESDALIFIGACGIAVRAIAPYLSDKFTDPAVVVIDEMGKFAVPILSGHVGGGNSLANDIADLIGAVPVITTATDVRGKFAVDVWANDNNLAIGSKEEAKLISAELLAGNTVSFSSDFPVSGNLPNGVTTEKREIGFYVTLKPNKRPYKKTLLLIPRIISLGIGCRKGTSAECIEQAVSETFEENNISQKAIFGVFSIDLKENEEGLIEYCNNQGLSFKTFSAEYLNSLQGDFTSSDFVKGITGTDSVCERAAVAGGGKRLIIKKRSYNGVTVAATIGDYTDPTFLERKVAKEL